MKLAGPATDKHEWHDWLAWYPVRTCSGDLLWFERVQRRWNPNTNFRILTSWDPGDYDGAWEYRKV